MKTNQQVKLKKKQDNDKTKGKTLIQTIKLIDFVLANRSSFEIIKKNIEIQDNEEVKIQFLNRIHQNSSNKTPVQKDRIYNEYYGWICERCKAKWLNDKEAVFSKKDFDEKYFRINSNPSIINAIFRTKKELDSLDLADDEIIDKMKSALYVKQIEEIQRRPEAKDRIIKDAIIDYIYHDNELMFLIQEGNYTKPDFDEFTEHCFKAWRDKFDSTVTLVPSKYSESEKNNLAIKVFDEIMQDVNVLFKECFSFKTSNKYFRNGCFLKLSNKPKIGWHPDWNEKYNN